jgi:hypothetical protein
MEAFEYSVVFIEGDPRVADSLNGANARGAEGWEAYGVTEDNTGWWVFLKRATGEAVEVAKPRRRNR